MGQTLSEKIISRVSGATGVKPGDTVWIKPDLTAVCGSSDFGVSITSGIPDLRQLVGVEKVNCPEKVVITIAMCDPLRTQANANYHADCYDWANRYGIPFLKHRLVGINHQALPELGLIHPGMLIAHHDTEVTMLGGLGALALGALPLLEIFVTGETWIKVPAVIKILVNGRMPDGVISRDLMLKIITDLGPDGALNRIVEFDGPVIRDMDTSGRMTLCNMANHLGAKSALVAPDQKTADYLTPYLNKTYESVGSDPNAVYENLFAYDATIMEPYLGCPPKLHQRRTVNEMAGQPIHQGYIGSCGGGREEDLEAAARILKNRKIHPRVRLFIVPNTPNILKAAEHEGWLRIFLEAGAFVSSPSCNFCNGKFGYLPAGETALTTGVLNVPGRHGSKEAQIYLASAYTIAASAINGEVTDPRTYL